MGDIKSKNVLYLKAALFVVIGGTSFALLIFQNPTVWTAILLGLVVWSFCRAYYFAFYVIEHYIDASHRYAGLFDFARYALSKRAISDSATNSRASKIHQ